jgi:hypothetical protein
MGQSIRDEVIEELLRGYSSPEVSRCISDLFYRCSARLPQAFLVENFDNIRSR